MLLQKRKSWSEVKKNKQEETPWAKLRISMTAATESVQSNNKIHTYMEGNHSFFLCKMHKKSFVNGCGCTLSNNTAITIKS